MAVFHSGSFTIGDFQRPKTSSHFPTRLKFYEQRKYLKPSVVTDVHYVSIRGQPTASFVKKMFENVLIVLIMLAAVATGMLLAFLTLPGVWFMLAVAVALELIYPAHAVFHPATLITLAVVAILGEVIEVFASAVGANKAGGSRKSGFFSVIGAMVGAIAGTVLIPLPIIGTIAGACIGAGLFALFSERLIERRDWDQSAQVARGAALGRLAATFVKITIAIVVGVALVWAAAVP